MAKLDNHGKRLVARKMVLRGLPHGMVLEAFHTENSFQWLATWRMVLKSSHTENGFDGFATRKVVFRDLLHGNSSLEFVTQKLVFGGLAQRK